MCQSHISQKIQFLNGVLCISFRRFLRVQVIFSHFEMFLVPSVSFLIVIGWCGVVLTYYVLFLVGGVTITYQITSGGTLQTNGTLTLCDALDDGTSEIFGLLNFITLN